MASWFPLNSWTRKVPLIDAMGRHTPKEAGDQAALGGRDLIGQRRLDGEQGVEEDLGDAPSDEDDRDVRHQSHDQDPDGTAGQTDEHPGPPHAEL
jgi:hypothetical protein